MDVSKHMSEHISQKEIEEIRHRYSERLKIHGVSPLALGWSDKSQQYLRFNRFYKYIERYMQTYSIMDVGCGFGDFASFLESKENPPFQYTGIDINEELIQKAQIKGYSFRCKYYCANILDNYELGNEENIRASIVMSAGLFNYNFHNSIELMHGFLYSMIDRMLELSEKYVMIDFIPDKRIDTYRPESYIAQYSIQSLEDYLRKHKLDYKIDLSQEPNPMQEALLIIRK